MKLLRKCAVGVLAIAIAATTLVLVPGKRVEAAGSVAINTTNFPDDNFRRCIKKYDKDSNGTLSNDEIKNVTSINVKGERISSLEGIGFFTELTDLICWSNSLTSLDLSNNTSLKKLLCGGNKIKYLDISNNAYLIKAYNEGIYESNVDNLAMVSYTYFGSNCRYDLCVDDTVTLITTSSHGWVNENNKWYYYNTKGSKVTGWQQIGGSWYFFNSKGVMQTGWVQSGGKWYFMSASGAMATGWIQSGGKWYFMGPSGAMVTGWVKSGGKWYFMSASGAMVANGWVKSGNAWYYFNANGAMVTGELVIDGKTSKFSSSGAWLGYV